MVSSFRSVHKVRLEGSCAEAKQEKMFSFCTTAFFIAGITGRASVACIGSITCIVSFACIASITCIVSVACIASITGNIMPLG